MLTQNKRIAQIIEGLNEFNDPSAQPAQPPTNKPNGANPTPAPAAGPTKAELTAAIEKARSEEKTKLYGQIEKEKEVRKELEAKLKKLEDESKQRKQSKLSGEEQIQAQVAEMQAQIAERDARMTAMLEQQAADRRAYELGLYREKVLRDAGPHIMPDLVRGASQAEIDQSLLVAKAEYAHWQQHFQQQFQPQGQPPQPVPGQPGQPMQPQQLPTTVQTPTQVMTQGQPPQQQPQGATITNPAPQPHQNALDPQYVAHMTSLDQVRSGEYAKNREAILARVRQGVTPVPGAQLPMRPMVPQQNAAPPPQPGYYPQTQQQMPHVAQPGGVMQPTGLPTPPVQNPNMPQHGAMGMPSVGHPQHQVPNAAPAPNNAAGMRVQAAQAAQNALQNPQGAIARAGATAVPQGHPEYQPQNPAATGQSVPNVQQLQTGHPQIRNS